MLTWRCRKPVCVHFNSWFRYAFCNRDPMGEPRPGETPRLLNTEDKWIGERREIMAKCHTDALCEYLRFRMQQERYRKLLLYKIRWYLYPS